MTNGPAQNAIKEIILRAWTDPSFKKRLMSDPKTVIASFGIKVDSVKSIVVIENDDSQAYFVLPEQPDLANLSDDQIRELVDSVLGVQLVLPTVLG